MKITINTFGTRGDIQPYVAVGSGLQSAGHSVRIFTHQIFEHFVNEYGLEMFALRLNPRQVLVNQAIVELGNNTFRITRWLKENFAPVMREIFEATLTANQDSDLVINSGLSFAGWHVAEKLNAPALAAFLWPMTPSHYMMGALGRTPPKWLPFRKAANYYLTKLFNQLFYYLLLPLVNECRKDILGLRPMKAQEYWQMDSPQNGTPILYGFSPTVIPKPPDWTKDQCITGYWFLDAAEKFKPKAEILEFLSKGSQPISIGFGSMVEHEKETVRRIVIDALRETDQRAVLLGGWSELDSSPTPDFIFRVKSLPHDWLFPRVAAAIHHGGAGTTAAALRAGVPNIVVPWFGDQFFWAERVQKIGAGPEPIPRKKLDAAKLSKAIRQAINNERIQATTVQIGQNIRTENGIETAVSMIEKFARNGRF